MKKNNKLSSMRKVLALSASFLLLFNACKKDGELIPDFAENTTNSIFSDSTLIETTTMIGDSILADNISTGLIGNYKDSAFGTTVASVFVQPVLSSNGLIFDPHGETLTVDSIVLSLSYSNYFGDTNTTQKFEVYRLTEKLADSSNYYSNTSIQREPMMLGSKTFTAQPNTSIRINQPNTTGGIDTVDLNSQLRIRLDDDLGSEILSKSNGSELLNNDNFTSFFNGLQIVPQAKSSLNNNEDAILYFNLTATNTQMTIYYTSTDTNSVSSKKLVNFPINTNSVRFNTFKHDYTNSAVGNELASPSTTSMFAYTQAMASVETIINFPTLSNQFTNKVLINKAELVLPAANGSYALFGKANSVILAARDDANKLQFIPDAFESPEYFGGKFDSESNSYKFNISRYVQGILNGTIENKGLTVLVTGSAVKAERAVFLTEDSQGEKIKLNLYYTNTN